MVQSSLSVILAQKKIRVFICPSLRLELMTGLFYGLCLIMHHWLPIFVCWRFHKPLHLYRVASMIPARSHPSIIISYNFLHSSMDLPYRFMSFQAVWEIYNFPYPFPLPIWNHAHATSFDINIYIWTPLPDQGVFMEQLPHRTHTEDYLSSTCDCFYPMLLSVTIWGGHLQREVKTRPA